MESGRAGSKNTSRPEDSVASLITTVLQRQPIPPRVVSYRRLLRVTSATPATPVIALFGVAAIVSGLAFWLAESDIGWRAVAAGFFVFGALMLSAPFVKAQRLRRALEFGLLCSAQVTEIDTVESSSRRTLEAMRNGYAAGRRRVHHPAGDFDQRFEFDGIGASQLRVGSTLRVLVAPERQTVLFELDAVP